MKVFGIETDGDFIRACVIEKQLRGAGPARLAQMAVAPEEKNGQTVAEFLQSLGYSKDRDILAVSFPAGKVSMRSMTTPLKKKSQIAETLPYELEAAAPLSAGEFVCGFMVTGVDEEGSSLLTVFSKNEDIQEVLSLYQEAGLDPDILAPAPLAALAGLNLPKDEEAKGPGCLVYTGLGATYFILVNEDNLPLTFHSTMAPVSNPERICVEMDRLALAAAQKNPDFNLSRVYLAGDAAKEDLKETVAGKLGVSPQLVMAGHDQSQGEVDTPGLHIPAAGAANMGAGLKEPVNLRSGAFRKTSRQAAWLVEAYVAAGLLAAVLAMWAVSFVLEGVALNREYSGLKEKVRYVFKSAMPEATTIVSEVQQLQIELNRLSASANSLGVRNGRDPFLDFLNDISHAKPKDTKLDIEELVYEPGRLILSGRTESFEKVDQLKNNLEKLDWVDTARLEKARAGASKEGISFRIEVDVAP